MKFTDDSIMPFGKHKGAQLADVPDKYLLWLYEKGMGNPDLRAYISDNLDAIKANIQRQGEVKTQFS